MSDTSKKSNPIAYLLKYIGESLWNFLEYMGGIGLIIKDLFTTPFRYRVQFKEIIKQFYDIGIKSLALTDLIAIFTGMVLALQLIVGLKRFGLELYSGQILGVAITRELGPVLTALMVAARVGSGIAAELGSMAVSEQVLAIRAMGGNPIVKLAVPRVLVTTLATPILTIIAMFIGLLGGMVITMNETGISTSYYIDQIKNTVEIYDFISGVSKTFFFGFLIGTIACFQGLYTTGGTKGVGKSTTNTVVFGSVAIFVSDFFLTKLFLLF